MKTSGDVLFLDTTHPSLMKDLRGIGYTCTYDPDMTYEKLISIAPTLTGIIVRSKFFLGQEVLENARNLRFIGRVGSGMENIDVTCAEKQGIACLNSPEGNRTAVAEHALGMLLALMNKLCVADKEVRRGVWKREKNRGYEISGKTLGIIGYGNTGSAFAQCLRGFEMNILVYDKYKEGFGNDFVQETDMDAIFRQADILSLHIPLTDETRYLVNSTFLEQFQKPLVLINTSRGEVVNTSDLLKAVKKQKVTGAALDVLDFEHLSFEKLAFEEMPVTFRELAGLSNVVLSPHIAGWTHESYQKLSKVLFEKIKKLDVSG
ncbi:MAG: NAD(P)-dependent oxidoreductase [Bacteroidales bacterium]